jgi:hypothetical protein
MDSGKWIPEKLVEETGDCCVAIDIDRRIGGIASF